MQRVGRYATLPGGLLDVRTFAPKTAAAAPSWWVVAGKTCVAAYQPKGAADLATSYVNLVTPGTYNAAPGVAPAFNAATGWTFNGATTWLTTGYNPVQTVSVLARFSDAAVSPSAIFGISAAEHLFLLNNWFGASYWGHGNFAGDLAVPAAGVGCMIPTGGYLDGLFVQATTGLTSGMAIPLYLGARNNAGVADGFTSGSIQAVAIYSDALTAGELAIVSAAMAAL